VPSVNTLVRWVNESAFVLEVQTRPCPTFGRPVDLEDCPHRLRPGTSPHALRIPPYGGHAALRSTASSGFRSVLAVSSFLRPARLRTPLLGYGAPHLNARGTSTLLNNALLSAHFRIAASFWPTIRTQGCRLSNVDRLELNITLIPNASWQRSTLTNT